MNLSYSGCKGKRRGKNCILEQLRDVRIAEKLCKHLLRGCGESWDPAETLWGTRDKDLEIAKVATTANKYKRTKIPQNFIGCLCGLNHETHVYEAWSMKHISI